MVASLPARDVAAGVSQDEKNVSSQTSNLTQTNDCLDLRLNRELFKRYLEDPYPVRKVVFYQPEDSDKPTNVLLCEGSLQPNTFYLWQCDDLNALKDSQYKNVSSGEAAGKSSAGEYWFVSGKAFHGTGGTIETTTADNPDLAIGTMAKLRAFEALPRLREASWFGFNFMIPHTVVWHGDQFDMQFLETQGYPQVTNTFAVSGEVLGYTNNLPLLIRVRSAHWPKRFRGLEFRYEYDFSIKDRFYPVKVTSAGIFSGVKPEASPMTTETLSIEFGNAGLPQSGYAETNFIPSKVSVPANIIITSTQGEYWVNGKQFVPAKPPSRFNRRLFSLNGYVRVLLIGLMILPAFVLVRSAKNKKAQNHNNQSTKL